MTQIVVAQFALFKYLGCTIMQLIAGKIFILARKELLIWYPLERKERGCIYKLQPQKYLGKLCFSVNICEAHTEESKSKCISLIDTEIFV